MVVVEDLPKPLRAIASDLEETGWAAEVCDADWRLVYVTSQLRGILGRNDDADLALGRHILEVRGTPFWQSIIDPERSGTWMAENVPRCSLTTPACATGSPTWSHPSCARSSRRPSPRRWARGRR